MSHVFIIVPVKGVLMTVCTAYFYSIDSCNCAGCQIHKISNVECWKYPLHRPLIKPVQTGLFRFHQVCFRVPTFFPTLFQGSNLFFQLPSKVYAALTTIKILLANVWRTSYILSIKELARGSVSTTRHFII